MAEEFLLEQVATEVQKAINNALYPDTTLSEGGKPAEGKAVGEAIRNLAKATHPDWNQNDEAAADYIKNRPFYEGSANEALLVEATVEVDHDMEIGSFRASKVAFVLGDTYTVRWNGTKYECVAVPGNGLWGETEFQTVDLKAPGVFDIYDYGGGEFWVQSFDGHGTFEIIISHVVADAKQIDSKFLPAETWAFTLEDGSTIEKKVVVAE